MKIENLEMLKNRTSRKCSITKRKYVVDYYFSKSIFEIFFVIFWWYDVIQIIYVDTRNKSGDRIYILKLCLVQPLDSWNRVEKYINELRILVCWLIIDDSFFTLTLCGPRWLIKKEHKISVQPMYHLYVRWLKPWLSIPNPFTF